MCGFGGVFGCSETTSSPHVAVSRRHHPVGVDQRAAADVLPLRRLDGHDVLDGMRDGGVASNDTLLTCLTHMHTHTQKGEVDLKPV